MPVSKSARLRRGLALAVATSALVALGVPAAVADPAPVDDEVPWATDPEPSVEDVAGIGAVPAGEPGDAIGTDQAAASARITAFRVPAAPVKALPPTMDAHPGFQRTISCDPVTRPGVKAFADLLAEHYGKPRAYFSRSCKSDASQHYDGRALDWPLNAYNADDKAIGDAVVGWLAADSGAVAKRFGIMYMIWDRRIWYVHRPAAWEAYNGPSPHTDHIHLSFTWDGAMKRTSWWTGTPVTAPDQGPCRVYAGQYAPRYTGVRTAPCPSSLPAPPPSPYPVYLPGARHPNIELAQASLGFTGADVDGSFGPQTLDALIAYQKRMGLPVTGVLDNATWVTMSAVLPKPPFAQIVASPDVTGDGRADVVTVDTVGRLHVYPGTGDGRVGKVRPFGTGWSTMRVYAPGDWDGDRRGDLVAVDAAGKLFLYAGDGSGGFRARQQIGHGWTGYRIVPAGDIDNNGTADLLAIDPEHRLWLYPGDGRGGFRARVQVGHSWKGYDLYAAGDMNRDGKADILSIDGAGRLWFYAGRGGGYFYQKVQVGHGWTGYEFASGADLNGDGINDLMGRDPQRRLWFYAGRPGGTFAMKAQVGQGW